MGTKIKDIKFDCGPTLPEKYLKVTQEEQEAYDRLRGKRKQYKLPKGPETTPEQQRQILAELRCD